MTKFEEIRALFPTTNSIVYANTAARNLISEPVNRAITEYLQERQMGTADKSKWFVKVEKVRDKMAKLIGADPIEVAFVKNTSDGINGAALAQDWKPGDNVIIVPDFEHPSNIYVWLGLKRLGVEVRTLDLDGPVVTASQLEQAVDERTRLIAIASVSFSTGGRVDLAAIGEFCEQQGIFLVVDAVQSLGVLSLDVNKTGVPALASATSKGLLGLYGMGILYYKKEYAEKVHPAYLGRYSIDLGEQHEQFMGDFGYDLAPGAKRFEIGNYNYLAIHALDIGLDHILDIGIDRIEHHILGLTDTLTRGAVELGYGLKSALEIGAMSHIVCLVPGEGMPPVTSLSNCLDQNGIRHSVRRDALRLSFHVYNNTDDVEAILEALKQARDCKKG